MAHGRACKDREAEGEGGPGEAGRQGPTAFEPAAVEGTHPRRRFVPERGQCPAQRSGGGGPAVPTGLIDEELPPERCVIPGS